MKSARLLLRLLRARRSRRRRWPGGRREKEEGKKGLARKCGDQRNTADTFAANGMLMRSW